jgi:hypothetical protein
MYCLRFVVAVLAVAAAGCSSSSSAPDRPVEIVGTDTTAEIQWVGLDGTDVVVATEQGLDHLDVRSGAATHVAGAEYRACPTDGSSRWSPDIRLGASAPIAVRGSEVVLADVDCGVWVRNLSDGSARVLAPMSADGDWAGFGSYALALVDTRALVCASFASRPSLELWSIDLAAGTRARVATIPSRHGSCASVVVDASAAYVTSFGEDDRFSLPSSVVYRVDLGTRDVSSVASSDFVDSVTQDDAAVYVAHDHLVERIDKATRSSTSLTLPTTKFQGYVNELAAGGDSVYGTGYDAQANRVLYTIARDGSSLNTLTTVSASWADWVPWNGMVVADGYVYFAVWRTEGSADSHFSVARVQR